MVSADVQESVHIKDYFDILRRRRGVVVMFFLSTVLVVALGSFMMKPIYRATATIMIDLESPNVLTTSGSVALESQNYYSYKDYLQTQMEIVTSRPILHEVFNEFGLVKTEAYANVKDPIKKFAKTIKVEAMRDTRLIELHTDNADPLLASKIANRIAEIYVKRNLAYISKTELLNLMKNEYLKLQGKQSEYAKIYKAAHPEMIKLKQEIADLVTQIEQEKTLISSYGVENSGSRRSTARSALEGLKSNNVNIVEPAEEPITPVRPRQILNISLAVLFGLLGGVALAFFFEYLDDTVNDVEALERLTSLPILGNVAKLDPERKMKDSEKDIFVQLNPRDPISEAYRSFRTNVLFSSSEAHRLQSLVLTSPGSGEGKTITVCNLAISVAQSGKNVLLVDADMRKPRLHDALKVENKTGLADFLSGRAGFEGLAQKTSIDNLSLVTSGPIPSNPAELLVAHKLKEFISCATEWFDIVIFDSPPIGMLTDATLIANTVDGVILVLESGKTSRRVLLRLSKLLKSTKARVLGTFLNKIPLANKNAYYYAYANQYSHYGT